MAVFVAVFVAVFEDRQLPPGNGDAQESCAKGVSMGGVVEVRNARSLLRQEQTSVTKTMAVLTMAAGMFDELGDDEASGECWDAYQFLGAVLSQIGKIDGTDILHGVEVGWNDMLTLGMLAGNVRHSDMVLPEGKEILLVRGEDDDEEDDDLPF